MRQEEHFDIYDEQGNHLGEAPRSVVHAQGYWHQTFHCWIVKQEREADTVTDWLLFQKRHPDKDTFPCLFDITAAGHLAAGETVEDGIREPQEELGIDVSWEQLHPLGMIPYSIQSGAIIDREMCHVFLLLNELPLDAYRPQKEEVTGLVQIRLEEAVALFHGQVDEVSGTGLERQDEEAPLLAKSFTLRKEDFVPHGNDYYSKVLEGIRRALSTR
ncbi:NUDIX hydrolase [Paenibacillus koleovorans]|uniref:NUDIX hydrolase n=1 Tax=Paenibacillus koleovorans TaxID=121608 RepID=UPI000FD9E3E6|nr:NUDIX domain-containing protein [Paenibacillus koleovorans]